MPVAGTQVSSVQAFWSSHPVLTPGTQPPFAQLSPTVHALPSVQTLALAVNVHPVVASHASVVHTLPSTQTAAGPGTQFPPEHASFKVQTLPSASHAVPPSELPL